MVMDARQRLFRGFAWAFTAAVMSALFMVPWKLAVQYGSQSSVVLVLLTAAAIFNTIGSVGSAFVQGRKLRIDGLAIGLALGLSMLTYAGNVASVEAIARVGGPLLSLLQRLEVVVVALGAWALLRERVDVRFWLGVAVAGLGLWVIGGDSAAEQLRAEGVAYGLASAIAFGSMNVVIRKYVSKIDVVTVNAMRLWLSVALWFIVERRIPEADSFAPALVGYAALAAFCGPLCARLSLMYSLRYLEARMVALCQLSAPLLTLIAAWLLLGHWPAERSLWGGGIMLVGIAIPIAMRVRVRLASPDAAARDGHAAARP